MAEACCITVASQVQSHVPVENPVQQLETPWIHLYLRTALLLLSNFLSHSTNKVWVHLYQHFHIGLCSYSIQEANFVYEVPAIGDTLNSLVP